jgi:5-methylcytosine-specific restriction protein A
MPRLPLNPCRNPGCPNLVSRPGYCATCAPRFDSGVVSSAPPPPRGNRHERGYGYVWKKLRDAHLRSEPYCRECARLGYRVKATDVDHILSRRHGGSDDPRNLQSLCHYHHSQKTAREDGRWTRRSH